MTLKKKLENYLKGLYIPVSKNSLFMQLWNYLKEIDIRAPTKEDAYRPNNPMLIIYTKGRGERETFHDYKVMYADFDSIGTRFALAYVHDDSGGFPKRIDITSLKTTLIC